MKKKIFVMGKVYDLATQGIKAFAYIHGIGIQIIGHGVIQIKHGISGLVGLRL